MNRLGCAFKKCSRPSRSPAVLMDETAQAISSDDTPDGGPGLDRLAWYLFGQAPGAAEPAGSDRRIREAHGPDAGGQELGDGPMLPGGRFPPSAPRRHSLGGARYGSRMICMPSLRKTASKAAGNFASRRSRNFRPPPSSWSSAVGACITPAAPAIGSEQLARPEDRARPARVLDADKVRMRPRPPLAGQLEHLRSEGRQHHRHRGAAAVPGRVPAPWRRGTHASPSAAWRNDGPSCLSRQVMDAAWDNGVGYFRRCCLTRFFKSVCGAAAARLLNDRISAERSGSLCQTRSTTIPNSLSVLLAR